MERLTQNFNGTYMSLYDYKVSQEIDALGYPFYALIMAAMRQADTNNTAAFELAFPRTFAELRARYNAPGGLLPAEIALENNDSFDDTLTGGDDDDDEGSVSDCLTVRDYSTGGTDNDVD